VKQYKNILIIKWGALGDLIASTPAIKTVRENFPESKITLLTNPLMVQIIPPGFLVDEHILINTNRNKVVDSIFKQLWTVFKLRKREFDLAINLRWTSERAALIAYLSGASESVSSGPKQMMNLYTTKINHPMGRYHEIHRNLDIVKAISAKVNDETPVVYVSEENKKFADDFFQKNNLHKEKTFCIHPGASRKIRAWMPERFAEIGTRLSEKYKTKILITWGKGEKELAEGVKNLIGANSIIAPETKSIGELAAIIQNCKMFLSNCTGPMNVSVAVKTPVIALLGSSDPIDWGAYGNKHINIKSPLMLDHYTDEAERKAMEAITVENVWNVVSKRWEELSNN
jgi:ADP-heptose:LPS heptosyltransferase